MPAYPPPPVASGCHERSWWRLPTHAHLPLLLLRPSLRTAISGAHSCLASIRFAALAPVGKGQAMDNSSLDAILRGSAGGMGEDYYSLLGCDELSSTEQILAEFKCQVLQCHPDKHPSDVTAAERFKKLQRAKEVLTDGETRGRYDMWRRSGLAIPFEQWNALSSSVQTSMHWATFSKKEPMLEEASTGAMKGRGADTAPSGEEALGARSKEDAARAGGALEEPLPKSPTSPGSQEASYWRNSFSWSSDAPSELLRKFRNYEI